MHAGPCYTSSIIELQRGGKRYVYADLREILRDGWTSKRMVVDLLSGMGYNEINILYAFLVCPVDFSLQAERAAVSYLTAEPLLSRDALIAQLEIEGFTSEEALHGADYAIGSLS